MWPSPPLQQNWIRAYFFLQAYFTVWVFGEGILHHFTLVKAQLIHFAPEYFSLCITCKITSFDTPNTMLWDKLQQCFFSPCYGYWRIQAAVLMYHLIDEDGVIDSTENREWPVRLSPIEMWGQPWSFQRTQVSFTPSAITVPFRANYIYRYSFTLTRFHFHHLCPLINYLLRFHFRYSTQCSLQCDVIYEQLRLMTNCLLSIADLFSNGESVFFPCVSVCRCLWMWLCSNWYLI